MMNSESVISRKRKGNDELGVDSSAGLKVISEKKGVGQNGHLLTVAAVAPQAIVPLAPGRISVEAHHPGPSRAPSN